MTNLLVSLYFALGVLIVAVELRRMRAAQPINALTLFNAAYFLFYVFAPLNVLVFGGDAVRQKYAYRTWSHGDYWTAFALILSYAVFVLGYSRRSRVKRLSLAGGNVIRTAFWLIVSFSVLGSIALAYHISLVGGVVETLQFAPALRTGEFQLTGKALFVRQFTYFVSTAFMLTWAVCIDATGSNLGSSGHTMRDWCRFILFTLGLVFLYYSLSTYGRREFLYPIGICFIIWLTAGQRRSRWGFGWLLILCVLWFSAYSIIIPTASQPATSQPATSQSAAAFLRGVYFGTTQGLGDSFMHFVAAQHASLWQFGFLSDLWEIPAEFLQSKMLGFDRPRGMFGETSEFILGRPLETGRSGEEPLGLNGYLLVNFSYLGMLLLFYLMGMGYRMLDAALRPPKGGPAIGWLVFLWTIVGVLEFFREGALILVLKPRFSWWVAIGILLWSGYRREKNSPLHQQSTRKSKTS